MGLDYKRNLVLSYNNDALRRSENKPDSWKVKERQIFIDLLLQEEKKSLLEIGAGTGVDSKFFCDNGFDVTAIDLSEEMIKYCKDKGLNARVMDFYNLEFPDETFDGVYAFNCLLHVPKAEIDQVLAEIKRVLKPNGLFYMGVYGGNDSEGIWENDWCEPKRFFAFYTDDSIKAVVKRHFDSLYFKTVPLEPGKPHFQSLILRKND